MKKSLLLITLLLGTLAGHSQWTNQLVPFTTQSTFFDVQAVDANTVWSNFQNITSTTSTSTNQFAKTTDGGNTWTIGTTNGAVASYSIGNIWPIDSDTCYVSMFGATSAGGIYKTINGGTSWTRQGTSNMFNSTSFPDIVHFFNPAEGVAIGDPNPAGYFEVWWTSDYGTTWTRVAQADIPACDAADFGYTNLFSAYGDNIWFGTDMGLVYRSTDKGHTWTSYQTNMIIQTQTIDDIVFLDPAIGFCFQSGLIYVSQDSGATWNLQSSTGTVFGSDVDRIPGSYTLISTGSSTTSAGSSYSQDLGLTWITIDTAVSHTGISFVDENTGWTGEVALGTAGGAWKYTGTPLAVNPVNGKTSTFMVYPNPSNGYVTVKLTNLNETIQIRVTDMMGRTVYQNKFEHPGDFFARLLDLSSYGSGLYHVSVDVTTVHASKQVVIQ